MEKLDGRGHISEKGVLNQNFLFVSRLVSLQLEGLGILQCYMFCLEIPDFFMSLVLDKRIQVTSTTSLHPHPKFLTLNEALPWR